MSSKRILEVDKVDEYRLNNPPDPGSSQPFITIEIWIIDQFRCLGVVGSDGLGSTLHPDLRTKSRAERDIHIEHTKHHAINPIALEGFAGLPDYFLEDYVAVRQNSPD